MERKGWTYMKRMRTAVVGCGAISDIYLTNMTERFDNLEVVACCANHVEHAQKKAKQYGIEARTYEEILSDPSIELVVILTPAPTHEGLIRQALQAGKHVYTEKTMTLSTESAGELIALAKEKGLYLGAAPDTFLGAALQTARKAIDDGLIGEITSFEACANRDLDLLAGMFSFLRMEGGGICYDFGVYYLTALVSLFGPVDSLVASVRNLAENRTNTAPGSTGYGETFSYQNESQVFTILRMKNGVTGTFSVNGDSAINDQAAFTVYGKKGILKLTDPNCFGGEVIYIPAAKGFDEVITPQVLDYGFAYGENSRGLGPAEMAAAIREGRTARADAQMAYHVLDVIGKIMESSEAGRFVSVASTCLRPEALQAGQKNYKTNMSDEAEPKGLLPLLNTSFEPGGGKKTVASFSDPDLRRIAEAELYYFSGEAEKCTAITESYLEEEEISMRLSACLLYSFSNFTLGNAEAAQSGFQKIQETLKTVFAGNESRELQASCVFAASMTCILVHLPTDDLPPLRDYVRYLPAGLRIFAAYLMAHKLYLEGKYERALGILDATVMSVNKPYPIPEIYLNCMISICRIKNKDLDGAKEAFLKAWGMAKPDGLLEAFIEHHGLLQGIVESCLKKEEPEAYKALTKGVLRFSRGWMKLHNQKSERNVTDALTPQEFAIAMLACRNWTNQEIADCMGISVNTVKHIISDILSTLHVNSRKELLQFVNR